MSGDPKTTDQETAGSAANPEWPDAVQEAWNDAQDILAQATRDARVALLMRRSWSEGFQLCGEAAAQGLYLAAAQLADLRPSPESEDALEQLLGSAETVGRAIGATLKHLIEDDLVPPPGRQMELLAGDESIDCEELGRHLGDLWDFEDVGSGPARRLTHLAGLLKGRAALERWTQQRAGESDSSRTDTRSLWLQRTLAEELIVRPVLRGLRPLSPEAARALEHELGDAWPDSLALGAAALSAEAARRLQPERWPDAFRQREYEWILGLIKQLEPTPAGSSPKEGTHKRDSPRG